MPISTANRSMARSTATAASGRPAPRNAVVGAAVVTTDTDEKPTLSRWYTPVSIRWVMAGRNAPITG
jgi:hypothetical protein